MSVSKILSGGYFVLYAYVGFGTCFTMLLLWMNFFVPASHTYEKKFRVADYMDISKQRNIDLENAINANTQVINLGASNGRKYLVFNYHYGILGIKKVDDFYFTDNE